MLPNEPATLREKLEAYARANFSDARGVDASSFGDPIASRTGWTQLSRSETRLRSHRLARRSSRRMEFRAPLMWPAVVVVLSACFAAGMHTTNADLSLTLAIMVLPALLLVAFVAFVVHIHKPAVFDLDSGMFWTGKEPVTSSSGSAPCNCRLSEIHALQILERDVQGQKGFYTGYELNIVLKDARRLNVTDHGSIHSLRKKAEVVAHALGVKFWDATREEAKRRSATDAHGLLAGAINAVMVAVIMIAMGGYLLHSTQDMAQLSNAARALYSNPSIELLFSIAAQAGTVSILSALVGVGSILFGIVSLYGGLRKHSVASLQQK